MTKGKEEVLEATREFLSDEITLYEFDGKCYDRIQISNVQIQIWIQFVRKFRGTTKFYNLPPILIAVS